MFVVAAHYLLRRQIADQCDGKGFDVDTETYLDQYCNHVDRPRTGLEGITGQI